ncbi:MAG: biotin-dependent carboxyltransferase family protein [Chitinophagaceae bacterium]
MSLRIIRPGISTTLQDAGRWGYQAAGVPVSGAMDINSLRLANILCGNDPGAVVLETTLHGAEWLVEEEQLIAFTGGGSSLFINNQPAPFNRAIRVKASSLLSLKSSPTGCRTYLAVAGGFKAKIDLKSGSTYKTASFGGHDGRALKAGDLLEWEQYKKPVSIKMMNSLTLKGHDFTLAGWSIDFNNPQKENTIRVFRGPEWDWFDDHAKEKIFGNSFGVSNQSDRMGYRLTGSPLLLSKKIELISTAVSVGTIQVTHEGHLVILMADAQTTGGYPRIAMVAAADLPLCAQLRPGDNVHFSEISIEKAEDLYLERERQIRQIQLAVSLKFNT